jgi:hypothetical protein
MYHPEKFLSRAVQVALVVGSATFFACGKPIYQTEAESHSYLIRSYDGAEANFSMRIPNGFKETTASAFMLSHDQAAVTFICSYALGLTGLQVRLTSDGVSEGPPEQLPLGRMQTFHLPIRDKVIVSAVAAIDVIGGGSISCTGTAGNPVEASEAKPWAEFFKKTFASITAIHKK